MLLDMDMEERLYSSAFLIISQGCSEEKLCLETSLKVPYFLLTQGGLFVNKSLAQQCQTLFVV